MIDDDLFAWFSLGAFVFLVVLACYICAMIEGTNRRVKKILEILERGER